MRECSVREGRTAVSSVIRPGVLRRPSALGGGPPSHIFSTHHFFEEKLNKAIQLHRLQAMTTETIPKVEKPCLRLFEQEAKRVHRFAAVSVVSDHRGHQLPIRHYRSKGTRSP